MNVNINNGSPSTEGYIWDDIADWGEDAVDDVSDWGEDAVDDVSDWGEDAVDDVSDWGEDTVDDVVDWTVGAGGDIADWTVGAANDVVDWTVGAANDMADWTNTAINDVIDWTTTAFTDAIKWFETAWDDFLDFWLDMLPNIPAEIMKMIAIIILLIFGSIFLAGFVGVLRLTGMIGTSEETDNEYRSRQMMAMQMMQDMNRKKQNRMAYAPIYASHDQPMNYDQPMGYEQAIMYGDTQGYAPNGYVNY